jgi:hypothetical protein
MANGSERRKDRRRHVRIKAAVEMSCSWRNEPFPCEPERKLQPRRLLRRDDVHVGTGNQGEADTLDSKRKGKHLGMACSL